jgi:hypothetical protein
MWSKQCFRNISFKVIEKVSRMEVGDAINSLYEISGMASVKVSSIGSHRNNHELKRNPSG